MGSHRSKGKKERRRSKMHDTNRGGRNGHSDNGGLKVATERPPAISGRIGFCSNFLAGVRSAL
jgi:hypothetical protein